MMNLKGTEKILLIQLRGLGDILLSTPLAAAVKKKYPGAEIHYLVEESGREVIAGNPDVAGIISRKKRSPGEYLRVMRAVHAAGFDIVIDLIHTPGTAWFVLASGAKYKIAFQNRYRKIFYNVNVPWVYKGYTVLVRAELLEPLGITEIDTKLTFTIPDSADESVNGIISSAGITKSDRIVTFDVTSVTEKRRWPKEHFARLADLLASKEGFKAVFFYGPGEKQYVENTLSLCREKHFLCPPLILKQLGAVLKRAKFHIGSDSFPKHLANAVGTPAVTIFGGSNPESWTPPEAGKRSKERGAGSGNEPQPEGGRQLILRAGLECQPCEGRIKDCDRPEKYLCLTGLKPEKVFEEIKRNFIK